MRRWMLLAIGLCALLWAATGRTGPLPPDGTVLTSGAQPCLLASDAPAPGDSNDQWRARHQSMAAVTESVWKSALVHAELAATPSARLFETARTASSPDPPLAPRPHALRHTPLLI